MPNSFFKFKQFTIHQDKCAMKVCTDACLFGAWLSETILNFEFPISNCLDIGTGTGLLALMYAQKNTRVIIDAIEIDEAAAAQAAFNFHASSWKERLNIICGDIKDRVTEKKYDLIICNPPFFENDLKSDDAKRNLALHSAALSFEELLSRVQENISARGIFAVLLPYHRSVYFEELAKQKQFYLKERVFVKQTPKHHFFRSMLLFSLQQTPSIEKEIIIQNAQNQYAPEFAELLKDYYLYL